MDIFKGENEKMLVKAIMSLKTEAECKAFLEDVMTTKEIIDISQRMGVVKMLDEKIPYGAISKATGASSTTISRVNRAYTYGTGGYKTVLKRIK
ncbi:MAG: hypothetical protein IKT04_00535 [Clostridia bacterium]|nr:hypothetical protein [Clostridia bacterium]MBR5015448.1 hypothetical protein [Clostridia bacterium]MBR5976187.1 hypothetical protein [Clostridia bacterium]MBR6478977.1 hypothetical protein [Clostridia bacterium]MBR6512199.1 hypothetical protein [Clostridia bacterium]